MVYVSSHRERLGENAGAPGRTAQSTAWQSGHSIHLATVDVIQTSNPIKYENQGAFCYSAKCLFIYSASAPHTPPPL